MTMENSMSNPNNKKTNSLEGMQRIHIQPEHWEDMRRHILSCLPNEACGILSGIGERIQEVIPVTNVLQSPYRFRMDPAEQLTALQRIDENRLEMIGIYHSHVHGPEDPSATDLDEAYYPNVAYLIWFPSDKDWGCRSFRMIEGTVIEIPLLVDS
jgi:proteasome lid subunit RPN8/RPN11